MPEVADVPRSPFVGRESELAALVAAWDEVKLGGGPRAVALLAESGLGKTRLVQELFSALVAREQGGPGYWPLTLRRERDDLRVNPDVEECDASAALPFLWWGLRLSNPGDRNRASAGSLMGHVTDYLVPHLEPFHREQRRRERIVKLAKIGARTAADAALDLVPVLGLLKKVVEVGAELKDIHDESRRDALAPDAVGTAAARRVSLAEEVVADLSRLFGSTAARGAPAVILVDDGQFSAADRGVCALVEALITAATAGGWPALLIVTHWEREWSDGSSPVAHTLRAGADGGLPLSTVRLGPIGDLTEQLRATLPGLLPDQEAALLERAGGNPLLLDEMLRACLSLRARGWFAGRDVAGPLTERGLSELLTRSGALVDLVADRFAETPDDVQLALGLGTLQGSEFEDWLVDETLLALGQEPARATREALAEAADPHALVARIGQTRAAFSQRVYRDVARESLGAWVDEEEARVAYLSALKAVVHGERPVAGEHALPALFEALAAAFEFDLDDPEAPRLAARGLTGLLDHAVDVGDLESASELSRRAARLLDRLDDDELDSDLWWLRSPVSALLSAAEHDVARPLLVRLVRLAGDAWDEDKNDWSAPLYAQALMDVASFHVREDDAERAVEALAMALDVLAHPGLSGDDPEMLEAAIRALIMYAERASRAAALEKAEEALQRALAFMETLAEVDPVPRREAQTATVSLRLARTQLASGRAEEAQTRLSEATATLRSVLSRGPDADVEASLLEGLDLLGRACDARGDVVGASAALEEELAMVRRRVEAAPGMPAPRSELAGVLGRLARFRQRQGRTDDAWSAANEAYGWRRQAHQAGLPQADLQLGENLTLLSELASVREEPELARGLADEALDLLRPLAASHDEVDDLTAHWHLLLALIVAVSATAAVDGRAPAEALLAEAKAAYERVGEAISVPEIVEELTALAAYVGGLDG